ncbi:MAG: hypothetical protein QOJ40_2726 [Verrucomicrobiota bacterium]
MPDRKPGPICTSKVGDDWIDDGTGCRARTSTPGPVEPHEPDPAAEEKAIIKADISLIGSSPFGHTPEGKTIVKLLEGFAAQNRIQYGDTEGDRGHFEGDIKINKDYSGKFGETILELVHEGSHATWRDQHPLGKGGETLEDAVNNELFAQQNELKIYKWVKTQIPFSDEDMEVRLRRQAAGKLKEAIEEKEKKDRGIK